MVIFAFVVYFVTKILKRKYKASFIYVLQIVPYTFCGFHRPRHSVTPAPRTPHPRLFKVPCFYWDRRLLAVPQDGHASEEIERSERNGKKQEAEGKLGRRPFRPAELRLDWMERDCSQPQCSEIVEIFKCTKGASVGDYSSLISFDTYARWQSVTHSARSRRSYGKIGDCEQSTRTPAPYYPLNRG